MYKTGILLLTTHVQQLRNGDTLQKILHHVKKYVSSTLYVHMTKVGPDFTEKQTEANVKDLYNQSSFSSSLIPFISDFYKIAALECKDVDVNILVHNIGYKQSKDNLIKHTFPDSLQCVLCDIPSLTMEKHMPELQQFIATSYASPKTVSRQCTAPLLSIHCDDAGKKPQNNPQVFQYNELFKKEAVVLGGTFDSIHIGHKILLTEALLMAERKVVIGVSNGPLLKQKILKELILPVEQRIEELKTFLSTVGNVKSTLNDGEVELDLVEITDPYGPSIVDPDLQAIVVSKETEKGGCMVNENRKLNGLCHLDMHVINNGKLLDVPTTEYQHAGHLKEVKISSSTRRYEKLGQLLKPINMSVFNKIADGLNQPYVIGLTGGIASGKTSVASRISGFGATIIDCDKLGHSSYLPGSNGFKKIVEEFGSGVVDNGFIDRKKLGELVFGNKDNLFKLNEIVWPEIEILAKQQIVKVMQEKNQSKQNGQPFGVIFLDAAVLLEAGWDKFCDEVWVVMVPENEALLRLMKRNNMDERAARDRIESQLCNMDRIKQANVVLSTLWEPNITQTQVEKAWILLNKRLKDGIEKIHGQANL